jgi:RND superfamily putative drug exporter
MSMTRADQRGSTRTRRRLVAAQVSPLGRLGSWSYRHRRLVAVAWIVVLLVISLAGRMAGSVFKDNLNGGTSTPSQQAATFLQRNFPSQAGDTAQVVFQTTAPVTAAAARDRITGTLAGLTRLPQVASVISPFAAGGAHQVSPDGHIAYGLVRFQGSGDAIADPVIQRVITQAQRAAGPGFAVQLGGCGPARRHAGAHGGHTRGAAADGPGELVVPARARARHA